MKVNFQHTFMVWYSSKKVGNHLPDYMVLQPRKPQCESLPPWNFPILTMTCVIFQSSVDILWYQIILLGHNWEMNAYVWLYKHLLYVQWLNCWHNWTSQFKLCKINIIQWVFDVNLYVSYRNLISSDNTDRKEASSEMYITLIQPSQICLS